MSTNEMLKLLPMSCEQIYNCQHALFGQKEDLTENKYLSPGIISKVIKDALI